MLSQRLSPYTFLVIALLISTPPAFSQQPSKPSRQTDVSGSGSIYVSNTLDGTVSVISTADNRVTDTIRVVTPGANQVPSIVDWGQIYDNTYNLFLSSDGAKLYVTMKVLRNVLANGPNVFQVVSTLSDTVTNTITDLSTVRGIESSIKVPFSPSGPNSTCVISPDGTKQYVIARAYQYINTKYGADSVNVLSVLPNVKIQPGVSAGPTNSRVSGDPIATKLVPLFPTSPNGESMPRMTVAIPQDCNVVLLNHNPEILVVSPNSRTVYVASADGTVTVVSAATDTVTATISVGPEPKNIAISPDGKQVYVVNYGKYSNNAHDMITEDDYHGTVSVISTATNKVIATIPVGRGPMGIVLSNKPPLNVPFSTVLINKLTE